METRDLRVDIKSLDEAGVFTGRLATYNHVDFGDDLIEPGAFTKTLSEGSAVIPLLWSHDQAQPLGTLELTDSASGLLCKGKLVMSVPQAKIAYDLLKVQAIKGLSIGYRAIKSTVINGVRHLKEVRLFEGSLVACPMDPGAVVTAVKSEQASAPKVNTEALDAFRNADRDLKDFYRRIIDGD